MAEAKKTRIGFVSSGAGTMPHYQSFLPLIPSDIAMDFQGLEIYGQSLYEIGGKKDLIVSRIKTLATERNWKGVIVTAAPTEVLNPGLFDALQAGLHVPFTTALHACVAALKVYAVKKVLLLTPFEEKLNQLIRAYLDKQGVLAHAPRPFAGLDVPQRMGPDEVFELAKGSLNPADPVDAIYFQGAVLDPIKVLERIETYLGITVIASNPAMLWYLLSKLSLSYPMSGYGKLLREWPALPE